ncbi:MAG: hypothetical protein AUG51_25970 [Acidobacteria bacterium 13_1_20CM_3_53_8]|nr:MAG: hypothetical protein AUG51_25970 [Acidobacteria bacterium 13_1_20CM_3_53_8]
MTANAEKLQQAERLIEEVPPTIPTQISNRTEIDNRTRNYTRHYKKQNSLSKPETKNFLIVKLSHVFYPTNSKTHTIESLL